MPDAPKPLLTVKQAATVYQVTERTIRTWVAKGAVPSVRVGGSRRILPDPCAQSTTAQ
jgi:excisionase family DNA binding protein